MTAIPVLLVDDDWELDQMLTEYLSAEAFSVITALDGAAALERLAEESFELVILDVMLPSLSGFQVLHRLRQTQSVPVIMLTARGEEKDRILGFDLGADDYLAKPFNPKELLARMRAALRRTNTEVTPTGGQIGAGALRLDPARLEASVGGQQLHLTTAEFRILELLMSAPGRTRSRERLTECVLGRRPSAYDRSIDTHITNLRRKLAERKDASLKIRSVRSLGYVLTLSAQ